MVSADHPVTGIVADTSCALSGFCASSSSKASAAALATSAISAWTAGRMRAMMSTYKENEDLISIGAYKNGTNPELDNAIHHMDRINRFLCQQVDESFSYGETVHLMQEAVK